MDNAFKKWLKFSCITQREIGEVLQVQELQAHRKLKHPENFEVWEILKIAKHWNLNPVELFSYIAISAGEK